MKRKIRKQAQSYFSMNGFRFSVHEFEMKIGCENRNFLAYTCKYGFHSNSRADFNEKWGKSSKLSEQQKILGDSYRGGRGAELSRGHAKTANGVLCNTVQYNTVFPLKYFLLSLISRNPFSQLQIFPAVISCSYFFIFYFMCALSFPIHFGTCPLLSSHINKVAIPTEYPYQSKLSIVQYKTSIME